MCKPGSSIEKVHQEAVRVLSEGLLDTGLLRSSENEIEKFYMHRTSHWLGMDVHDVGRYQEDGVPIPFEEGMILTVEPGLYFNPDFSSVDTPFDGIGVRIEDDVLITKDGHEVLSSSIPKEMDEIESRMKERYVGNP
jgi:Xaa-Pro aminopeptidase